MQLHKNDIYCFGLTFILQSQKFSAFKKKRCLQLCFSALTGKIIKP